MRNAIRALGLATAAVAIAFAGSAPAEKPTRIAFADIGNIRDWRADTANELYIQSMDRDWYKTTFWAPCAALPFATAIAFVTEPNGDLNSFSSVLVEGERCWFKTFEKSNAPPTTRK
jgi:hypothetical protein